MTSLTRLSLAAAATLLLGACADSPTAPAGAVTPRLDVAEEKGAQRYTYDELYEFEGDSYLHFTCEDGTESEPVQLFGRIAERYTFMITPSGRHHYVSGTMPVGLYGIGAESGQEYRVVEREHSSVRYDESDVGGGSLRETLTLRGRDTGATFGITYLVQWRFAGSGDMIVNRWKELETCRP